MIEVPKPQCLLASRPQIIVLVEEKQVVLGSAAQWYSESMAYRIVYSNIV